MLLLVNNLHEKHITESQDGLNFGYTHVLFVICTCVTTLHLCYMRNMCNFFMQIINKLIISIYIKPEGQE